jgi:hypothetical protein
MLGDARVRRQTLHGQVSRSTTTLAAEAARVQGDTIAIFVVRGTRDTPRALSGAA